MAVTITNKFYETSTNAWHDIAKIVFTSPNIDSPANAGTRSHILPGQGDLGLWYEDTSKMYRVASTQFYTEDDFYTVITGSLIGELNLDSPPASIYFSSFPIDFEKIIMERSFSPVITSIKEVLNIPITTVSPPVYVGMEEPASAIITDHKPGGSPSTFYTGYMGSISPLGKQDIVWSLHAFTVYNDYFGTTNSYSNYYVSSASWVDYGFYVTIVPSYTTCYIMFEFDYPISIYKMSMSAVQKISATSSVGTYYTQGGGIPPAIYTSYYMINTETYNKYAFIGNFTIQGSNDLITWTTLFTGANTTSTTANCYFTSTGYYLFYRICLLNNTGLSSTVFDVTKYALRDVKFYEYVYSKSDDASGGKTYLYNFGDNYSTNIVSVKDLVSTDAATPTVTGTYSTSNITGSIALSTHTTPYNHSKYSINLVSDTYNAAYTLYATTISGAAVGASGTVSSISDNLSFNIATTDCYFTTVSGYPSVITSTFASVETEIVTNSYYYTETDTYLIEASVSGTSYDLGNTYSVSGTVSKTYNNSVTYYDKQYGFNIDSIVAGSGTIAEGSTFSVFNEVVISNPLTLSTTNSVVFELTAGEAYNCRLTAWDDTTHSTTLNTIISSDRARVDAVAYCAGTSKLNPNYLQYPNNSFVFPPVHNRILKGNVSDGGYHYYYGDFDLKYRPEAAVFGDYLLFRPYLYNIDETVSYGVHDFYITLHYSYT